MLKITVPIKEVSGSLYMHETFGEGTYGDMEVASDSTIPDRSIVVNIKGKGSYLVSSADIVKAVCAVVSKEV